MEADPTGARRHVVRRIMALRRPPLREETSPSGVSKIIYRYADLKNFCQVTLILERGKVRDFSADHSAPEFFWLVDGSNYCGRIFKGCIR